VHPILSEAHRVFDIEAQAILDLKENLAEEFVLAVEMLSQCKGKVVVSGIGKSGHVARKLASTLSSTGTPSVFLHPSESSHGDLGLISDGDVIILMSYGGENNENSDLIRFAVRQNIPLIAITGRRQSSLAESANVVLDISVKKEACPLGLAPTASSTATLAMADALAMAVLKQRGFGENDFARLHPGGTLGRRLLTRVKDVMHTGDTLPLVNIDTAVREVIAEMTRKEVRGVAGVIDSHGNLIGIVTDGDVRRRLEKSSDPLNETARDLMSTQPKTIDQDELAERALFVMEQFLIQTLFVVDKSAERTTRPVGLVHLQDLLRAKVR
jgi:arabinose-5-phosphate isomerase